MKPVFVLLFGLTLGASSLKAQAAKDIEMSIEIPKPASDPAHRPYLAIWLENAEGKSVSTIAVWYQKDTWLKDLRQWWRKAGRDNVAGIDAYSGATRKPGSYPIKWSPVDGSGKALPPGKYTLNFEAAREEAGRDHVKQVIELGGKAQEFTIAATKEIGVITIKVPAL
ncbi:MAG: DUF2271 domain-containing protein [Proteobacteria bacterium]|nr:MAG: DUF2271 domain-containing protein [Pseudomonadota bacterium]